MDSKFVSCLEALIENYDNGVMTYQDFIIAKSAFHQHYHNGQSTPFNSCIDVSFDAIANILQQYGQNDPNLGLTFIHRFDPQTNEWFVCMELCTISIITTPDLPSGREVSSRTALINNARWDIRNNSSITPSTMVSGYMDLSYFTSMYYSDSIGNIPQTLDSLDPGRCIFVQSVTFPWQEIMKLYKQNGKPGGPSGIYDTAILSIQSCTSGTPYTYSDATIQWPHGIWMFMKNKNINGIITSCLIQGNGDDSSFTNNAADVGSMCPPRCGVYVCPKKPVWSSITFSRLVKALIDDNTDFHFINSIKNYIQKFK